MGVVEGGVDHFLQPSPTHMVGSFVEVTFSRHKEKSEEKDIRISDCAKSKIASENVLVLKKRYYSAKGLFERLEQ